MNQISNQQQGQGQHTAPQVAQQLRYSTPQPGPPAPPFYIPPSQPQQYYYPAQQPHHATLSIPPNSQITASSNNGHNYVEIAQAAQGEYGGQPHFQGYAHQSAMLPQYPVYQPHQQQYGMPYATMQYQQHQQQPVAPKQPPPQKREKKILSIVHPDTNSNVELPHKNVEPSHTPELRAPSHEGPVPEQKRNGPTFQAPAANKSNAIAIEHPKSEVPGVEKEISEKAASAVTEAKPDFTKPPPQHSEQPSILSFVDPKTNTAVPLPQHPVEPSPAPPEQRAPSIVLEESQAETSGVEEETPEVSESDAKPDRATLMANYEKKLEEFISVPENLTDITNKKYSRALVQLLREIIRDFNTVPCPIPEHELKRIGIDRATMPAPANVTHHGNKNKFSGGRDSFNPSWQHLAQANQNPRKPYNSRPSHNKDKSKNQNPRPPITGRQSIQRQKPQPRVRGENVWTPDVMKKDATTVLDPASEEAKNVKIEKVRKDVRGLLNKITPSTYADLSVQMINKAVWKDLDTLPTVVELIFIKAVEEPTFVSIYSDLCQALHRAEQNMEKADFKRSFHGAIIRKCQDSFESTALSQAQESINKVEEEIKLEEAKEEKDQKKLDDLRERLEELNAKEKRRMLGTIRFISHLFRIGLLNFKIIENCIVILIRKAESNNDELTTEYSVELIKQVGPHVAEKSQKVEEIDRLNSYVDYLNKFKGSVSNRVKFMILDLSDLRGKKWEKKTEGPKTKEQVKMDVAKEEQQNQREREMYEQTTAAQAVMADRKRSTAFDKQRYQGRPSADNKKDRIISAVAASHTAGSAIKKDMSLSKAEQSDRLGATKKWGAKAQNAAPPPAAAAGPVKRIERKSQDARNQQQQFHAPYDGRKSANRQVPTPTPKIDPRSASATPPPPPAEPSSSRSQNNSPTTFTPEDQYNKGEFKSEFKEILKSLLNGTPIEDVAKSLIELNNKLNNPIMFIQEIFRYCCEVLKKDEEKERQAVARLVVKCVEEPTLKNAFSAGFKKYCNHIVVEEIDEDVPHLRTTFPQLVAHIMTDPANQAIIQHKDFIEGFKEFHESENPKFGQFLAEFGTILKSRDVEDIGRILSMTVDEFAELDPHYKSEQMQDIYKMVKIDIENHKNLKELLDANAA